LGVAWTVHADYFKKYPFLHFFQVEPAQSVFVKICGLTRHPNQRKKHGIDRLEMNFGAKYNIGLAQSKFDEENSLAWNRLTLGFQEHQIDHALLQLMCCARTEIVYFLNFVWV